MLGNLSKLFLKVVSSFSVFFLSQIYCKGRVVFIEVGMAFFKESLSLTALCVEVTPQL